MAQAAVLLRRNHEKEKRRREQEQNIDHSVTTNPNSDVSFSGAGRNSTPEIHHSTQIPDKDVWVGVHILVVLSYLSLAA